MRFGIRSVGIYIGDELKPYIWKTFGMAGFSFYHTGISIGNVFIGVYYKKLEKR